MAKKERPDDCVYEFCGRRKPFRLPRAALPLLMALGALLVVLGLVMLVAATCGGH